MTELERAMLAADRAASKPKEALSEEEILRSKVFAAASRQFDLKTKIILDRADAMTSLTIDKLDEYDRAVRATEDAVAAFRGLTADQWKSKPLETSRPITGALMKQALEEIGAPGPRFKVGDRVKIVLGQFKGAIGRVAKVADGLVTADMGPFDATFPMHAYFVVKAGPTE